MDSKPYDLSIPRPLYDERLKERLGTPDIKVLTGIRRCGKSTLMRMLVDHIRAEGFPEDNIFYRRFDQFGMPVNPQAEWLLLELQDAFGAADSSYPLRIFLDEIQEVAGWEKVVRQLHTARNADVFMTGSNAYLLSSDLSTFLAGRYTEIDVYPLSYREYCSFAERIQGGRMAGHEDALFARYLKYGGMPGLFEMTTNDERLIQEDLANIFDSVILNDVARHARITDMDLLIKLIRYVFSTSGSLFSTKKIADALTSAGRKVKSETVDNYIHALQRAYALYECEQAGLAGKKVLRPLRKLYPADTGLRNMTISFADSDLGYQLENVVFLELKRRGYEVLVGALPSAEIDFMAKRGDEIIYIQVAASVVDEAVLARETAPLEKVGDAFPKLILTLDSWRSGMTSAGIRIQPIADWLLS